MNMTALRAARYPELRASGNPPTEAVRTKFSVSFGGHKDGVGTIELGKPKGFDALTILLQKLSVPPTEIEIACQVLTAEPHHEIPNVILRRGIFRHLGL
jgi:hypothetical protein